MACRTCYLTFKGIKIDDALEVRYRFEENLYVY